MALTEVALGALRLNTKGESSTLLTANFCIPTKAPPSAAPVCRRGALARPESRIRGKDIV